MTSAEFAPPDSRGLSLAAMITGLASLLLTIIYLVALDGMTPLIVAIAAGVVGIVLGSIALRRRRPDGMALTGIITGALSTVIGSAMIIFAFIFIGVLFAQ